MASTVLKDLSRTASRKPYKSLPLRTVDHARRTATLYRAMLEEIGAAGMNGRQSEGCGLLRQSNALGASIADTAGNSSFRNQCASFLPDFYSTLNPLARAVLLDTPRRVEMDVSSFAASKLRALLDTYLEPCLLDTQMSKSSPLARSALCARARGRGSALHSGGFASRRVAYYALAALNAAAKAAIALWAIAR
jgi:hypothetical protein